MLYLPNFGHIENFCQKKLFVTFLDLLNPNFMRKLKMGNEPALEGVLYRWTELN